MHLYLFYL